MEKKKAAAAAVASVIAASGAAVEATVDDPTDLLQQTSVEPQVDFIVSDVDQDAGATDEEKQTQKKTAKEALGDWILGLPYAVRVLVVLPMWIIGTLVVGGVQLLITAFSPVLNWVISFALIALVLTAAFTLTAKAMFPDLPIGKILNRHTFKWILIASVVAFAADLILGIFWVEYTRYKMLVIGGILLIALGSLTIWFSRREKIRREKEAAEAIPEPEEPEELVYSSLGQEFTIRPSHRD